MPYALAEGYAADVWIVLRYSLVTHGYQGTTVDSELRRYYGGSFALVERYQGPPRSSSKDHRWRSGNAFFANSPEGAVPMYAAVLAE